MNDPALQVEGLTVRFGSTIALDSVDLTIETGEVVAVVGPSGCGKSTLLRSIAGLQPLSGGRILAAGRSLDGVPTHERGLGLMFQDHALFTHETVAGNVGFGLRMASVPVAERRDRVEALLSLVGLSGFGDRSVATLSGGEAQRVALARSLAPNPALLMLDEPLGSLDRVLRRQLTSELRALLGGVGVSALHVTHDQAEAFAVADRVVVLRAGRIVQSGSPQDLWFRPASRFVAEFLGHPNLWPDVGGTLLVPVTAVRVDPTGELEVRVVGAAFADGRFVVESEVIEPIRADAPRRTLVFETATRPVVGETLHLRMDRSQVRTLDR